VKFPARRSAGVWHYKDLPLMFDWSLDPKAQLGFLCVLTALVFWNNDPLFYLFSLMAICTRVSRE
jgi:hypothetical protein